MTLLELIRRLDPARQVKADIQEIAQDFGLDVPWDAKHELVEIPFTEWCCTDTWVGSKVLFLDQSSVAVVQQDGRKSPKNYFWIDDGEQRVFDHCVSMIRHELQPSSRKVALDEEMGASFKVAFPSQILQEFAIFDPTGERVKIVFPARNGDYSGDMPVVFPDGDTRMVNICALTFPFLLRPLEATE